MCVRVNKITVNVDRKYDETKISLYKTNELLGIFTDEDLNLPQFSMSGVSLKAYQAYCKDFVIALLDIDGIPGYYYEPKADGNSIKYDSSVFKKGVADYIQNIIGDNYEFIMTTESNVESIDRYKDGYLQNATGEFDVKLTQFDLKFTVLAEIKSGQLCRPRIMRYEGTEFNFNITNISRIIKQTQ